MRDQLIKYLKESKKLLSVEEIFKNLNLEKTDDFVLLVKTINELDDEGIIYLSKNNLIGLMNHFNYIRGIINVKEAGFGFVTVDEKYFDNQDSLQLKDFVLDKTKDIYINFDNRKNALDGDCVLIELFSENRKVEGKVIKIIKRASQEFIGFIKYFRKKYLVESLNKKTNFCIVLEKDEKLNYKDLINQVVRVKITNYFEKIDNLLNPVGNGKIIEIYDDFSKPGMDLTTILLASDYKLDFTNEVKEEIVKIPMTILPSQYEGRTDLTNEQIITIDGDDAKDLDDAIKVEKLQNGNYLLGVYIADVSEYVKTHTAIDESAYNLGTSTYLPDRVVPMLPKELSNGICSLNEGVKRLVLACEMEIDELGKVINHKIFKGFIKTSARMTYNDVNAILKGNNELNERYQNIVLMLKNALNLAKILYQMRIKRGAFEFETLESKIILDHNLKAIDVKIVERGDAEKMIEEFMLIANETVAETMKWLEIPFIYRVHDEPNENKMADFMEYASLLGYKIKTNNKKSFAKSLQQILLNNKNNSDLSSKVINKMLLRTMAKAKYQINNIGHFGLASECYTHFTSPIRRYPDLIVHRLIKQFLLNEKVYESDDLDSFANLLYEESEYLSSRERIAESVERLAEDIKKTEFISSKIGKRYEGIISSITNYGCYVMLDNSVEGYVAFENMPIGGFFEMYPKEGTMIDVRRQINYTIGERVLIKVISTNKRLHQIDFQLIKKVK